MIQTLEDLKIELATAFDHENFCLANGLPTFLIQSRQRLIAELIKMKEMEKTI